MKVLDLFSGMGGWSQAFLDRGHDVTRVDNDVKFAPVPYTTIHDVLAFWPAGREEFDIVLASPPCQAFSLAAIKSHMDAFRHCRCGANVQRLNDKQWICNCGNPRPYGQTWIEPRSDFAKVSVALVNKTLELVNTIQPKFWWMENPNGCMIHFVPPDVPRVQVTYCQYGESRMKLTNLWGNWPDIWQPRPRCFNGMTCHDEARRGATTGTQGIRGKNSAALRALVPYELSMEVCMAVEAAL